MNELVSSAFTMAENGLTAINNAQNGQPQDDDQAKSDNINNIVNWMLIPTGEQPRNLYLKDARSEKQPSIQ